jgi:GGDEF domain-containing protein
MRIQEARKYLTALHKLQKDPFQWPDFMTGLPDRGAVYSMLREHFPKLGQSAISYIRIDNIQPFLVKYGTSNHVDVIQWCAAILKTSMDEHKGFVGTMGNHDFIAICDAAEMESFLKEASEAFSRHVRKYYTEEDLSRKTVISFRRNGTDVELGLMRLQACTAWEKGALTIETIIPSLERCSQESSSSHLFS